MRSLSHYLLLGQNYIQRYLFVKLFELQIDYVGHSFSSLTYNQVLQIRHEEVEGKVMPVHAEHRPSHYMLFHCRCTVFANGPRAAFRKVCMIISNADREFQLKFWKVLSWKAITLNSQGQSV